MLRICSCGGCTDKSRAGDCLTGEARPRWYAVQCLSNREFVAAVQLHNQGFATFLPCQLKTRRHARRFDSVRRPLFPGYLFVQLDLARDRWRSVNGTLGVVKLVGRAEQPSAAPAGSIEAIRAACDESDVIHVSADIAPGDVVRVTCGPFSELVGKLERLDGAARVRVLLELMGRRTSVVLPRDQIIPELAAA
jgi:transcription elongation factor/antiterminator RfaH